MLSEAVDVFTLFLVECSFSKVIHIDSTFNVA